MEQIRRAIYSLSYLAAAIVGMLWYSITAAIRVSAYAVLAVILSPFIIIASGIMSGKKFWDGRQNIAASILDGFLVSIGFAILAPILLGGAGVYLLATFLTAPILGFKKGWDEGFGSVWANGLKLLPLESRLFPQEQRAQRMGRRVVRIGLEGGEEADLEEARARSNEAIRVAALRPMTIAKFNELALSAEEYEALVAAHQVPLTNIEKAMIRAIGDDEVTAVLRNYEELEGNLVECALTLSEPAPKDAIILVKQYKVGGKWLAAPGSHLFDKNALETAFTRTDTGNALHPLTRDNILAPEPYKQHETRYIYHPLYIQKTADLKFFAAAPTEKVRLCQERDQLVAFLRSSISPTYTVTPDPYEEETASAGMTL
jgi:hypothetical protein